MMPRISAIALTVVGATIVAACSTPKAGDLGSAGVGGTAAKAGTGGTAITGNAGAGGTVGNAGSGGTSSATGTGGTGSGEIGGTTGTGGSGGLGNAGGTTGTGGSGGLGNAGAAGDSAGAGGAGMGTGGSTSTGGSTGAQVSVDATGKYTVTFAHPAWTFAGTLGAAASAIMTTAGSDAVGSYRETTFSYSNAGTRNGRIRAYDHLPVVVFGETNPASGSNIRNFPVLSTVPTTAYHLAHQDIQFAPYTLSGLTADSPWVFFDGSTNAFIVSAASHFTNAQTTRSGSGGITVGIDSKITTLPAGFEQTAVLAADVGINQTHDDWGTALRKLGGKKPIANDATPDLAKLSYWTDNKATYYYKTQSGADYQTTLKNVAKYFQQLGTPIGSIQLDSWWYPKGSANSWEGSGTDRGGEYLYEGDSTLFPSGLAAFQQSLGLPLITHARWIDSSSPYRSMYKMSGDVSIDPAFWSKIASFLKSSGVATYEQDWLNMNALPSTSNLTDQDAFTDNMAQAMATAGISIQYCMALPRFYLQASKYQNLVTARASEDGFARDRGRNFFYTARLAWSMGLWPWTDVFMSNQHDNLLISTLTGGMMGVGDAINGADKASIMRAIRADGALIKPDAPILLTDKTIVAEAQGKTNPSMATTYSDHTGGRTTYVFGFTSSSASLSFTPAELGYSGSAYVYDVNKQSGRLLTAMQANADTISDTAYYVVAPVGKSGIAFLGEQGKIAPLGNKRISDWSDDGTLSVSVLFASGEASVTLTGYAPSAPVATADTGTVGAVQYDATSKRFTVPVSAAGSSASLKLHL
jgi:hypothetical protein